MFFPKRSLGLGDFAVVGVGLLAIAALQVTPDEPAEKTGYVVEKIVEYSGPAPSSNEPRATKAYEEFLTTRGYYGAFAMSLDGAHGWSDNHVSQAVADRVAMLNCLEYSESCEIIARLRPVEDVLFQGRSLSFTQAEALDAFPGRPDHKAIAFANFGVWGAAWERPAPFIAKQAALANCQQQLETKGFMAQPNSACRLINFD